MPSAVSSGELAPLPGHLRTSWQLMAHPISSSLLLGVHTPGMATKRKPAKKSLPAQRIRDLVGIISRVALQGALNGG